MSTPGGPGERWWENQPPSGGYESPPSYPAPPSSYPAPPSGYPPPPSSYPPPSAYPPPPSGYPPSAPSGYPPSAPYQPGYPIAPQSHTNGLAIGSLVASILAIPLALFCFGFGGAVAAIAGIVMGVVALNQIKQSGDQGRGLALSGVIIGGVALVLGLILIILLAIGASYQS
jgi:hypothetical protein